ncbi:MAG: hypothetical protein JST75_04035 [Bacteroidetes bacterium]|nr:hypothetical protein [Bacteroidota bacterium]
MKKSIIFLSTSYFPGPDQPNPQPKPEIPPVEPTPPAPEPRPTAKLNLTLAASKFFVFLKVANVI